jgi:hypothetical protein
VASLIGRMSHEAAALWVDPVAHPAERRRFDAHAVEGPCGLVGVASWVSICR